MKYALIALLCFVGWLIFRPSSKPLAPKYHKGHVSFVIDGDTLILTGSKLRLRLWGVDAPENGERGAQEATSLLKRLCEGKPIKYIVIDQDRYGRTVARVFLKSGLELNKAMIESPHASEYMRYSKGFYSH